MDASSEESVAAHPIPSVVRSIDVARVASPALRIIGGIETAARPRE
jgi:hypothetical protein